MKKFTKRCLIAALVLFILGIAFSAIFGFLGGFAQLDNGEGRRAYSLGSNGLKFGYDGDSFGFGFWEDDEEWEDSMGAPNLLDATDEKVKTSYTASDITDIVISIGGNNLVIEESEDEYVWVENKSSVKTVKYGMNNGVFELKTGKNSHFLGINFNDDETHGKIYLYLPKGMNLESIDLELGGGNINGIALEADAIEMEAGAGNLNFKGLTGEVVDITLGAGKADIDLLDAETINMELGAGDLDVKELIAGDLTLEVGMGNLNANGQILKTAQMECGMGNLDLILQGEKKDYDFNVECSMGNVKIGEDKYSNIAAEHSVDNGSDREINVECSMGNVTIDFK